MVWWTLIGAAVAAGVISLVLWLRRNNVSLAWYYWLIFAIGAFLMLYTVQNFAGLMSEGFYMASWYFILFIGLPAILLLVIFAQKVFREIRSS